MKKAWGEPPSNREQKKSPLLGGFPLLPWWSRSAVSDLVRAAPLRERSLSDRSYFAPSVIGGMTWTYLRPSLPSRNATEPSVSANKVWSLPRPTLVPGLSVGVPAISLALCWSAVASAVSFARAAGDFPAPAFGVGSVFGASALLGAGFFSAL